MSEALQQRNVDPGPIAMAKMYAQSDIVPKHYQNKPANILIALDYARHMNEPVLGIMRCTFVVHGTLGFKSEFLIGKANASGIFDEPIQYESVGEPGAKDFKVRAGAPISAKMLWGPWVTLHMVTSEGWFKNAKYKSMPELMFRYRAATFFVRQTCPQVLFGAQTVEELEDLDAAEGPRDVSIEPAAALTEAVKGRANAKAEKAPEPETIEAEVVETPSPKFVVCVACDGEGGECLICAGTGEVLEEVAS